MRLVAAHEHISSLLEAALLQTSPMRQQLTAEQALVLHSQLNSSRAAIEECVALARPARPPAAKCFQDCYGPNKM